jgi:hypothetical protein
LLGLLREGVGVGAVALESLGVIQQAVRSKVIEIAGEGQPPTVDDIPFTSGAQRPWSGHSMRLAASETSMSERRATCWR